MLRVRAVLFVMLVALLAGGWLWGQDAKQPIKTGRTLPKYWSKAGLSEEQKQKAFAIMADYRGKIEPLKQQIAQLEKQEKTELEKILTEEQKKNIQKQIASKVPGGDPGKEEKKPEADKKPE